MNNNQQRQLKTINLQEKNPNVINKIKALYGDIGNTVHDMGTLSVNRLDAEANLDTINEKIHELEVQYKDLKRQLNEQFNILETEYPNATLDLDAETITYVE